MEKVLITGGAGFIGSNLAIELLKKGYQITIIDCLSEQIHGPGPESSSLYNSVKSKVNFIRGSVNSRSDLINAIADNDIIVHLAAETGVNQSMYEIEKYVHVNIHGTALLVDLLINHKNNVRKVVIGSSRAVYGEGKYLSMEYGNVYPKPREAKSLNEGFFEVTYPGCRSPLKKLPTDENSLVHPCSVYGITKLTQEQMVTTACSSINMPWVILRYQNVYGPGQSLVNAHTGIIPIFSKQIVNGNTVNVFEDGKESRDFIFVDDAVNATIMSIENDNADNQILNIGSGESISIMNVIETLLTHHKREVSITVTGNYRFGDIRHNFADTKRIKDLLGFTPRISFDEGVKRFTKWFEDQPMPN